MNFRVQYTEVTPGGSREYQDEAVHGDDVLDVVYYLAKVRGLDVSTVKVWDHGTESDAKGRLLDHFAEDYL